MNENTEEITEEITGVITEKAAEEAEEAEEKAEEAEEAEEKAAEAAEKTAVKTAGMPEEKQAEKEAAKAEEPAAAQTVPQQGESPEDSAGEEAVPAEDPRIFVPAVEAVLFALGRAVSPAELGRACFCPPSSAKKAALLLQKSLEERGAGIMVREFDGMFQMCSSPVYYESLIRLVSAPKKPVLTDVVMETLAIIAYKSPATKVEIEKIRGVSSDHAVNRLVEYGLVEETGRLDAPGRPVLFAPTQEFYRRFGVSGKSDMPVLTPDMEAIISEEVETEMRDALDVEV